VLGIGGASPISKKEDFVSCLEGMRDELDNFKEFGRFSLRKRAHLEPLKPL
jgi:hypothetical protein